MKYRNVLMLASAALLLSGAACQAAGQCRSAKLYRRCVSNSSSALCGDNQLCQMQADASATFTCYSLKVPCSFNENDLGDTAFAVFQYPIVGAQYNVPRELAR